MIMRCICIISWGAVCARTLMCWIRMCWSMLFPVSDPEEAKFEKMKAQVEEMPKKHLKRNLEKRGVSGKGSHDVLQKRLLQAIEADHDAHIEQTEAERIAWEAEQERIAEEEAEKEAALAHLTKVNSKFAALKAPALRKQLAKRGLKTTGKKAQLLERLANALEVEYAGKREQAKRIAAEEARIAEIAAQQDAADAEYRQLVNDITKMKKPALMKELTQRELDVKGKQDELSTRLLGAVEADRDAADEVRRDEAMSEEEKLSREVAERGALEEAERLEAEEALAEQLALEEEAERVAAEDVEAVIGECFMCCVTHGLRWPFVVYASSRL